MKSLVGPLSFLSQATPETRWFFVGHGRHTGVVFVLQHRISRFAWPTRNWLEQDFLTVVAALFSAAPQPVFEGSQYHGNLHRLPGRSQSEGTYLEPALEGLLRSSNVHEEIIMAFRCQDVLSRAVFVALDTTEEGLTETATAFGIKAKGGSFEHKREMAKLIAAWQQGRIQNEVKVKVDAISKAHGEPVSMPPEDYEVLLTAFKEKHGKIHDSKLPAQSYFESFQDKLQEGRLKPETLAQVVSLSEEEVFEAAKPEAPKNFAIHLDSTLTVQSKKRYLTKFPASIEELRRKYAVMENLWLLSKMRTPGRYLFADLDERTWAKFLDILLSDENFLLGI